MFHGSRQLNVKNVYVKKSLKIKKKNRLKPFVHLYYANIYFYFAYTIKQINTFGFFYYKYLFIIFSKTNISSSVMI